MNEMQSIVDKFLLDETKVSRMMARLILEKLEKTGVKGRTIQLDELQAEVERKLSTASDSDLSSFIFDDGSPDTTHCELSIEDVDVSDFSMRIESAVGSAVVEMIEVMTISTYVNVKKEAGEALKRRSEELDEFQKNLCIRWKKPLQLFALQIGLAVQCGGDVNGWLRSQSTGDDRSLVEAITRLHARACQVAGEVEALLKSGFADGALARWRTLHELVIVTWFIQSNGQEVARRYLDHLVIDSRRMARMYREATENLGHQLISDEDWEVLDQEAKSLETRYGKEFSKEYGWAAQALGKAKPNFSDIERAVDFGKLRPYYKLASDNVHAGPKGVFYRVGLIHQDANALLAGPSNAGLAEAGRLTSMSLAQISVPLMLVRTTIDSVVWTRVMFDLSHEVEDEFLAAQTKLERDDRFHARQAAAKFRALRRPMMPMQRRV